MLVDVPNGTGSPVQSLRNAALAQAAYEKLDQPSRQAQTRKLEEAVQSETGKFAQLWGLVTEGSRTRTRVKRSRRCGRRLPWRRQPWPASPSTLDWHPQRLRNWRLPGSRSAP